jgi:dTDP-6-deoxy-L-talose 4-dehydrogenase (NAD+)
MKIAVTGGTGFIGSYVVTELLNSGIEVIVTGTSAEKAKQQPWFSKVLFVQLDINADPPESVLRQIASADKLIHLAWGGLPNYKELYHLEEQVLPQYFFIKKLVLLGMSDITVTGTCFEYGMKSGPLNTSMPADPQNAYALAKDTVRKYLQQLQLKNSFRLKWVRLFYMYGKGQAPNAILVQLEKALEKGERSFNMSGGEQLRDYLPVEAVAKNLIAVALDNEKNGIYNCCSNQPVSIRKLVENYLAENNKTIQLNLGYYPYPDYEPMAFWGVKNI